LCPWSELSLTPPPPPCRSCPSCAAASTCCTAPSSAAARCPPRARPHLLPAEAAATAPAPDAGPLEAACAAVATAGLTLSVMSLYRRSMVPISMEGSMAVEPYTPARCAMHHGWALGDAQCTTVGDAQCTMVGDARCATDKDGGRCAMRRGQGRWAMRDASRTRRRWAMADAPRTRRRWAMHNGQERWEMRRRQGRWAMRNAPRTRTVGDAPRTRTVGDGRCAADKDGGHRGGQGAERRTSHALGVV
jgi:hypothetical protein